MTILPRFIFLRSNANKYFRLSKAEKGLNHSFIGFPRDAKDRKAEHSGSEKALESPKIDKSQLQFYKFEVEKAKTMEGFIHLRTCYNNKYWARKSADSNLMVAEANEPEEDPTKWSCTLFKPVILDANNDDNSKKMHLLHQGRHHVATQSLDDQVQLVVSSPSKSNSDEPDSVATVLTVTDAGAARILPEYVAFKAYNDSYVGAIWGFLRNTIGLKSTDIGEGGVAQRISYAPSNDNTRMNIINHTTGTYWSNMWLSTRYTDTSKPESAAVFSATTVDNRVALKDTYKDAFDSIIDDNSSYAGALSADYSTITKTALFRLMEPVLQREIINPTYKLDGSRTYNVSSIEKFVDSRSNNTTTDQKGSFMVEYKISKVMSWNRTSSMTVGIKASWSGGIPEIGKSGIEISKQSTETLAWGEVLTEDKIIKYSQDITIPPGKKVTLKVTAQKAYCDVPFSCKVRDLMTFGTTTEYELTDGLYTGCNEYQFQSNLTSEDL